MKTDTTKDVATRGVAYYEGLPYTVTIRKDDEGDFMARIAELPGCIAHGESESAAIDNLRTVQRLWMEEALSAGLMRSQNHWPITKCRVENGYSVSPGGSTRNWRARQNVKM